MGLALPIGAQQLAEKLNTENCLGWFGAGVSAAAGFPTWRALLEEFIREYGFLNDVCGQCGSRKFRFDEPIPNANQAEREKLLYAAECVATNQLKTAASALRQIQGGQFVLDRLQARFNARDMYESLGRQSLQRIRIDRRLKALRSLRWAGVVTTNFDKLLECGPGGSYWDPIVSAVTGNLANALRRPRSRKPFLIYLHGNVGESDLIFADEDYTRHYISRPSLNYFLKALFLRYTVVFIGTQIDAEIVQLKQEINESHRKDNRSGTTLPAEIVILPSSARSRGQFLEDTGGFQVLYFEQGEDYSGLDTLLEDVFQRSVFYRSQVGVDEDPDLQMLRSIVREHGPIGLQDVVRHFVERMDHGGANLESVTHNILYRLSYLCEHHAIVHDQAAATYRIASSD